MISKTQRDLIDHLKGQGLDPVDYVWATMLDITYLMPRFIENGGTYSRPTGEEYPWTTGEEYPSFDVRVSYPYPTPVMKVAYGGRWLLLTREISNGYPIIKLMGPAADHDNSWTTFITHPDLLDAALLYLLDIPNDNATQL